MTQNKPMTTQQQQLVTTLKAVLKPHQLKLQAADTQHFRTGWRSGQGDAFAVVFPDTLLQFWRVLEVCVDADVIMIIQGANTGLTEGSTPSGTDYDRDIVIINTLAMNQLIMLPKQAKQHQIISFPGATLHTLEQTLKPLGRTPHSVIGSSCLGASIIGGVANNSGGALVKRGPAYTEYALFARVDEQGQLELVNHLGIDLGTTPEQILTNLQNYADLEAPNAQAQNLRVTNNTNKASASDYIDILRDVNADTPTRFNADPSRLYEASGCAGKVAVFAVRLDTFEQPKQEQTFYIGTNAPNTLTQLRRHILTKFKNLPEVGEYFHRDMFDVANQFGKDTFLSVSKLGTDRLPKLFELKTKLDRWANRMPLLPNNLSDKIMQSFSRFFPQHLPSRLLSFHQQFDHHLILKMSDDGIEEAKSFLTEFFADNSGAYFVCDKVETDSAYLHRFVAAGAAMRYQAINEHKVGEVLALDIALKRNDTDWFETLPIHIADKIDKALYYGHFFCYVFHQDYILKKGVNAEQVKKDLLAFLDTRGAKYPAEHNVGHLYDAEQQLKAFYQNLDPTNRFNPGIGNTSKHRRQCGC
ncbi:D-lactate dehydrogenase [Psychrosphaera ytuae]|nr:D-lactate dehydrogenase [Psychrosphaera ytuae]